MQFGLTEEQEMIVSTVRSFVENEIYPHEALVERMLAGHAAMARYASGRAAVAA